MDLPPLRIVCVSAGAGADTIRDAIHALAQPLSLEVVGAGDRPDVVVGTAAAVAATEAGFRIVTAPHAALTAFADRIGSGIDAVVADDADAASTDLALRQALHAARRAVHAGRLTDDLVTGVGHELRTPLTGVTGALEMLRDELERRSDGVADAAVWLEMAERNADALRRQVVGLLDAVDNGRGVAAVPAHGTAVATVLAEVTAHAGVGFDIEAANTSARVRMSAPQLGRVLAHLAAGLAAPSVAAAGRGRACVQVRVRRTGSHVAIVLSGSVPDTNGPGLRSHAAADAVRRAGGVAHYDARVPCWHLSLPAGEPVRSAADAAGATDCAEATPGAAPLALNP